MTNPQIRLITAGIVFGLGSVGACIGFVAKAIDSYGGDGGPVPGGLAMVAGFVLGVAALIQMAKPENKFDIK